MNKPRLLGGLSASTAILLGTACLVAWDRVDKLIESRDAWRDRATTLERRVDDLNKRVDREETRDKSEDAWRRNADGEWDWTEKSLRLVMARLGVTPPPGPYHVDVPQPVASARPRNLDLAERAQPAAALGYLVP